MAAEISNGFTKVANELIEALACQNLSGRELRIVLAIIRKTYGFQKNIDWIAREQLVELTGLTKENCSHIVSSLIRKKIIVKEGNGYIKRLGINAETSEWLPGNKLEKPLKYKEPKQPRTEDYELLTTASGDTTSRKHNVEFDTEAQTQRHKADFNKVSNMAPLSVNSGNVSVEFGTGHLENRHPQNSMLKRNSQKLSPIAHCSIV